MSSSTDKCDKRLNNSYVIHLGILINPIYISGII